MPLNKRSEMEFRNAYILNNPPGDRLVRVAVQDILNLHLHSDEIFPRYIIDDLSNAGVETVHLSRIQALIDEELMYKLSWLLADTLNTPEKLNIALEQVEEAAHFIHNFQESDHSRSASAMSLPEFQPQQETATYEPAPPGFRTVVVAKAELSDSESLIKQAAKSKEAGEHAPQSEQTLASSRQISVVSGHRASGGVAPATHNKRIVERGLIGRVRLFMRRADRVQSLTLEEAQVVFSEPRYLFVWHALPDAMGSSGETSDRVVKTQVQSIWERLNEDAQLEWSHYHQDLVSGRRGLREILARETLSETEASIAPNCLISSQGKSNVYHQPTAPGELDSPNPINANPLGIRQPHSVHIPAEAEGGASNPHVPREMRTPSPRPIKQENTDTDNFGTADHGHPPDLKGNATSHRRNISDSKESFKSNGRPRFVFKDVISSIRLQ